MLMLMLHTPNPLNLPASPRIAHSIKLGYSLTWRQQKLIVKLSSACENLVLLPPLTGKERLVECLAKSPVMLVCLSPDMGEEHIRFWADVCLQAGKPLYLSLKGSPQLPHKVFPWGWHMKRSLDWLVAALLVTVLSPLFLVLALLVKSSSPGPIFFQQWRVGERGKLFRIIKFRTMQANAEQLHHQVMQNQAGLHKLQQDPRVTPMGYWLRKYSLDELPQLFNVLRGEMSLVGPRPWALYDAIRITPDLRHRLKALPGITGAWQVAARSTVVDLNLVNSCDLKYLNTWSLGQDLKFLVLTIPKVLTGFGAY